MFICVSVLVIILPVRTPFTSLGRQTVQVLLQDYTAAEGEPEIRPTEQPRSDDGFQSHIMANGTAAELIRVRSGRGSLE